MIRERDVIEVLDLLESTGATAWVDGGWGVDALLGEATREHSDLDLVVLLDQVPLVRETLRQAGFTNLLRDWLPTALAVADYAGRKIDLHPITPIVGGGGHQLLPDGAQFYYPAPVLGRIGGREVRCVDAATQMLCHVGHEPTAKDRQDVVRLHERTGVTLPEEYRTAGMTVPMSTPAQECMRRAADWAGGDPSVRAAVVFGSVARGLDTEYSDLDLILVTTDGTSEDLWERRAEIAESILGGAVVAAQEPSWQGEHRYQAWTVDARGLDLTIVNGVPTVFGGLAKGFVALFDPDGIGEQLATACAAWSAPHHDAAILDDGTWAWLRYLHGRLQKGELFAVRAGLFDTLMYRVVPMLGSQWHSAHAELSERDMQRIHAAAPASAEPAELARALYATATTYDWALDRWTARTGRERPHHALAALTLARLRPSGPPPDHGRDGSPPTELKQPHGPSTMDMSDHRLPSCDVTSDTG